MLQPAAKIKSSIAGPEGAASCSLQNDNGATSVTGSDVLVSTKRNAHFGFEIDKTPLERTVNRHHTLTTQNNFDLIRLCAALQVMVGHVLWHVGQNDSLMSALLGTLPGVPVFFFTSGFLISGTYERDPDLRNYFRNRILRIYPALWVSVLLSLALISVLYSKAVGLPLFGWSLMQATIFQDWNPSFLRGYGIGVANGSLWTIPVELCFYAATPVIYWAGRNNLDKLLIGIVIISFTLLQFLMHLPSGSFWQKAALLTPFPWIGMFACGVLARRYLYLLERFVAGQFFWWLALFVLVAFFSRRIDAPPWLFRSEVNALGMLHFFVMAGLVLAAACSMPRLASLVLRRNDISYGIYILHMPIINALLEVGLRSYVLAMGLTLVAATASWLLIEKPALRLKRAAGRPI